MPTPKAAVLKAISQQTRGVDAGLLLTDIIDVWGGTRQLAVDIRQVFVRSNTGGMTQQRILEMIQRLIIGCTDRQLASKRDPSRMSNEELQEFALEYLQRFQKTDTADDTAKTTEATDAAKAG